MFSVIIFVIRYHFHCRQKAIRSSGLVLEASGYCTRSYLENQLARALLLQSPVEYRCWLTSLVRFLLEQGNNNSFITSYFVKKKKDP